jgi:hypothetical protein
MIPTLDVSYESETLRLTQRTLDPTSRLGEILFGVIMVLTVTLTSSFAVDSGQEGWTL